MLETIQRESVISFPMLGGLTINPPAYFNLFGWPIYFYGVLIGLGFILGILFCARRAKRFGYGEDDVYDVMIWVIPCSILGARLGYAYNSIIGPLAFNLFWSNYTKKAGAYVSIGYNF